MNTSTEIDRKSSEWICDVLTEVREYIEEIERRLNEHHKGGICYNATKKLLEIYYPIKFDITRDLIAEAYMDVNQISPEKVSEESFIKSLEFFIFMGENFDSCKSVLSKFTYSIRPQQLYAVRSIIESAMKILKSINELEYNVLERLYFHQKSEVDRAAIAKDLGISLRSLFRVADKAITSLSVIIWGPLGERYSNSFKSSEMLYMLKRADCLAENADILERLAEVKDDDDVPNAFAVNKDTEQ